MIKKSILPVVLMLCFFCGCTTSTVKLIALEGEARVSKESGKEILGEVQAGNSGWFLFGCKYLPILSGEIDTPNTKSYDMFTNNIKQGYLKEIIDDRVKRAGGTSYENLNIRTQWSWLPWIIIWRQDISGKAIVVK